MNALDRIKITSFVPSIRNDKPRVRPDASSSIKDQRVLVEIEHNTFEYVSADQARQHAPGKSQIRILFDAIFSTMYTRQEG